MTGFGGLFRATGALKAASYGLDVTGQNIANANTDGYTRQRADEVSVGPTSGVPQLYAKPQATDQGVSIRGTTRLNDPVVDDRDRLENSRSSYLAASTTTASAVETAFPEPTTAGLSKQLDDFYNSWSALASAPNNSTLGAGGSTALRQNVISTANQVVTSLHTATTNLASTVTSLKSQLSSTVTDAQNQATQLGQLNTAIMITSTTGGNTNALADQRDKILASLAKSVGAVSTIQSDGSATVTVGGNTLVSAGTVSTIAVDATFHVTVGGTQIATPGSSSGMAGALDIGINTTVPLYQAQLDSVASTLASTVNTAHQAGYDASGTAGTAFFTGTTASAITVAITNPSKIAASGTASATGNNDGSNASALFNLSRAAGSAGSAYVSLVGQVGNASSLAASQETIQKSVTDNVDAARQSASGVNYDEEVTNLLMYQRSYQAAARVLTTIDSMLDTLINRIT